MIYIRFTSILSQDRHGAFSLMVTHENNATLFKGDGILSSVYNTFLVSLGCCSFLWVIVIHLPNTFLGLVRLGFFSIVYFFFFIISTSTV